MPWFLVHHERWIAQMRKTPAPPLSIPPHKTPMLLNKTKQETSNISGGYTPGLRTWRPSRYGDRKDESKNIDIIERKGKRNKNILMTGQAIPLVAWMFVNVVMCKRVCVCCEKKRCVSGRQGVYGLLCVSRITITPRMSFSLFPRLGSFQLRAPSSVPLHDPCFFPSTR